MNALDDWKSINTMNKNLFIERWGSCAIQHEENIIIFGGYSQGR